MWDAIKGTLIGLQIFLAHKTFKECCRLFRRSPLLTLTHPFSFSSFYCWKNNYVLNKRPSFGSSMCQWWHHDTVNRSMGVMRHWITGSVCLHLVQMQLTQIAITINPAKQVRKMGSESQNDGIVFRTNSSSRVTCDNLVNKVCQSNKFFNLHRSFLTSFHLLHNFNLTSNVQCSSNVKFSCFAKLFTTFWQNVEVSKAVKIIMAFFM